MLPLTWKRFVGEPNDHKLPCMNHAIPCIRVLADTDSIDELTSLLHRAYARLRALGLNFTAVDQSPEVTAQRVNWGTCYVAVVGTQLVGTIVVRGTHESSECSYFNQRGGDGSPVRRRSRVPGHGHRVGAAVASRNMGKGERLHFAGVGYGGVGQRSDRVLQSSRIREDGHGSVAGEEVPECSDEQGDGVRGLRVLRMMTFLRLRQIPG